MRPIRQLSTIKAASAAGLALLALLVAGSSTAAATAPSSSIGACVNHKSRTLYLAHRCARHDRRLTWSVTGATGASGAAGTSGPRGATGAQGPAGPFTAVLPSGQSLRGAYGAIGSATGSLQRFGTAISFGIPLAGAPTPNFVAIGEGPTAACPGSVTAPAAAPGDLCIYEAQHLNVLTATFEDPISGATGSTVQRFGAEVVGLSAAAGNYDESGSWAVTAP